MILAIDIGNSSVSCGVYKNAVDTDLTADATCLCRFKIAEKHLSEDEYMLLIHQFLSLHGIRFHRPDARPNTSDGQWIDNPYMDDQPLSDIQDVGMLNACVIASVVPSLTDTIARAAKRLTGVQPLLIGHGVRTGFGIKIQNPEQLGADLVANVAGAFLYVEPPFVVLDVGTATTLTYVSSQKEVLGTIIMPGIAVSMAALTDSAALLSTVSLEKPQALLGRSTSESIRSGVIGGHALMIDGFLRNIRETYPSDDKKLSLAATGGLAPSILPYCRNKFSYVADLTLRGAVSLHIKNGPGKRL